MLRRLTIGLVALVTLIALFYAVVNWRGSRAWAAHLQELKSRGESVVLADLGPAPVPAQDNLAEAPFFQPLFDTTETEGRVEWNDEAGKKRLEGFKAPRGSGRGFPPKCTLGSLEFDCWTDFAACLQFYLDREAQGDKVELAGETDAARLLSYLGKYDADIEQLAEAARHRGSCRFPVEYDADMPMATLLPHLGPIKGIGDVLSLRAIARLEVGEVDGAFEDLQLSLRLSEGIADEPILISHLVRLATLRANLQVIREGILRRAWASEQLEMVSARLASIHLIEEAERALQGERAAVVGSVDYLRRQKWWQASEAMGIVSGSSAPTVDWLVPFIPDGWLYRNMLNLSVLHQEHTFASLDVEGRRIDPPIASGLEHAVEDLPVRPSTVLVKMLLPALNRALIRTASTHTYLQAARVGCALERCRLAGHALPPSLEDLVPEFLERVPSDVIDGQPLRYRRDGDDAYVLHGVGWNRQDDGGRIGWEGEGREARLHRGAGDWVWSMRR
jgi:hypothetical protein